MWRNELKCGFFQNLKKIFLEYKLLLFEPNIEFKKLWEENPLQLTIVLRRIRADMRSKKTVTELVTIAYVFVFFPSNRIFVGFQQPSTRIGHIYSFHSFLHIFSLSLKHKQLESKVFLQRTNLFDKKRETKKKKGERTAVWLAQLVGRAPVCQAGGRGFKPRPDQRSGSLNNWEESVAFVMISVNG